MATIENTQEQESVIQEAKNKGGARIISVDALPGSGKTTLLQNVANEVSDKKILYLVFNDHNAKEAEQKLGSNVDVYSFHKLAHRMTLGSRDKEAPSKKLATDDLEQHELVSEFIQSEISDIALPIADVDLDKTIDLIIDTLSSGIYPSLKNNTDASLFVQENILKVPLLSYLDEKYSLIEKRNDFSKKDYALRDSKEVLNPYVGVALNLFSKKIRDGADLPADFLACLTSISNKALEMGNLEVKPEFFQRGLAWKRAQKTLADIMSVVVPLGDNKEADNKAFQKFSSTVITDMCNGIIDYQVNMSNDGSITHGAYLAEFSNSNKPFYLGRQYDFVLLDEAQDTNNACWNVIRGMMNGNKDLRLIMVGDEHQSIYSFRHAKNVLEESPINAVEVGSEDFMKKPLTKVFRVGGQVADFANAIIKLRHEDIKKRNSIKQRFMENEYGLPEAGEDLCETPMYMCDPSDKDRGRVISSMIKKSVVEAFKQKPTGTPAIICANNLDNSDDDQIKGVLNESLKEIMLGNKVALIKGGSAYKNALFLALSMRFKCKEFETIKADDRLSKVHEASYQTVLKELSREFSEKPGFLLQSKYHGPNGEKLLHSELVSHFGDSLFSVSRPGSSEPMPGVAKGVYERFLKAGLLNQLTKQNMTANIVNDRNLIIDFLNEQKEGLGEDKASVREAMDLTESYRLVICKELLNEFDQKTALVDGQNVDEVIDRGIEKLLEMGRDNIKEDHPSLTEKQVNTALQPFKEILMKSYSCGVAAPLYKQVDIVASHLAVDNKNVFELKAGRLVEFNKGASEVVHALNEVLTQGKTTEKLASSVRPETLSSLLSILTPHQFNKLCDRIALPELGMPIDEADLLIGTVHKTKGLEYPIVALSEDIKVPGCEQNYGYNYKERWNAALIASTRATHGMILNKSLESSVISTAGACPIATKLLIDVADEGVRALDELRNKGSLVLEPTAAEELELNEKSSSLTFLEKSVDSWGRGYTENTHRGLVNSKEFGDGDGDKKSSIYNAVELMGLAKDEILSKAVDNIATDMALSTSLESIMNKSSNLFDTDSSGVRSKSIKETLRKDFAGLENGVGVVKSPNSGFGRSTQIAMKGVTAVMAAAANEAPVEFINLRDKKISVKEYLEKRNIPDIVPMMNKEKQCTIYSAVLESIDDATSAILEHGISSIESSTEKTSDIAEKAHKAVVGHLFEIIQTGRVELEKSNGDYIEAFPKQSVATLSDPDAFSNQTDERKEKLHQNKQDQKELEKVYKKIKFSPDDKTNGPRTNGGR